MGYVLRGEGHEREAFRLVYKRRLEHLGLKLQETGQADLEANAKSKWPKMKADLMVKEISQLHQERHDLRREQQQLQKRGVTEAELVEGQLRVAKHGTQQTRERRDALRKLVSGAPAFAAGDVLQAEETRLAQKVEALRKETQELTARRQELYSELQESHSSQAQQQGQVTWELRQLSAQQAHCCALQVEVKLSRDKLRMSEMAREELHQKHLQVATRCQTTLALARREAVERMTQLKQRLQQEDDAADCLGEAADQKQAQVDAANERLRHMDDLTQKHADVEAQPDIAVVSLVTPSWLAAPPKLSGDDELKSSLSSALSQIDDLKRQVQHVQAEKSQLLRLASVCKTQQRLLQICGRFKDKCRAPSASWKEEMEKMRGLLASPVPSRQAATVAQRVLEAFNEEVPCHSMDLTSLLMGTDDAYVVPAVTQLIQAEVKRQASAIHASLLQTRPQGMEELVGRVQELQKQLLLEVVSSSEDVEDEEIRDVELHLALLVGRRHEVLRR